jgi:hypothetical protein
MTKTKSSRTAPHPGRHEANCKICAHPLRAEIEQDFIGWRSPARITSDFKLRNRSSIYRHAHAFNLFSARDRNLRGALSRLIERVEDVPASAGAIVAAVGMYAKISSGGRWVEPKKSIDVNAMFERMTDIELENYAKEGTLPEWFRIALAATDQRGPDGDKDE